MSTATAVKGSSTWYAFSFAMDISIPVYAVAVKRLARVLLASVMVLWSNGVCKQ